MLSMKERIKKEQLCKSIIVLLFNKKLPILQKDESKHIKLE